MPERKLRGAAGRALVIFVALALLAAALAGCGEDFHGAASAVESQPASVPADDAQPGESMFHIQEPAWVVLSSGSTGKSVAITDPEEVWELTRAFNDYKCVRGESSEGYIGWSYSLEWFDSDGHTLESVVVKGEELLDFDGYFYTIENDKLSLSRLEEISAGLPEASYAQRHPVYVPNPGTRNWARISDSNYDWAVTVSDPELARRITACFEGIEVRAGEEWDGLDGETGYAYFLDYEDDRFRVVDAHTVIYAGYYHEILGGEIDMELLNDLADPEGPYADREGVEYWTAPETLALEDISGTQAVRLFHMPGTLSVLPDDIGRMDLRADINDPGIISELKERFSGLEFRRGDYAPEATPYLCHIYWMKDVSYDETQEEPFITGGSVLDTLTVVDEETVVYNGRLCTLAGGKIDTAWLEGLLNGE